jgi:hypothetical protein
MESIGILFTHSVMASLDLNFNLPGTMKYENAQTSRAFSVLCVSLTAGVIPNDTLKKAENLKKDSPPGICTISFRTAQNLLLIIQISFRRYSMDPL